MKIIALLSFLISFSFENGDTIKRCPSIQSKILAIHKFSVLHGEYRRIAVADSLISKENFIFESHQNVLKNRPIILMCLDESNYTWHAVHISIPYPTPISFYRALRGAKTIEERESVRIPINVLSNNYVVKHVYGANAARFYVNVFLRSKDSLVPLIVYRMKYPNIQGGTSLSSIIQKSEAYHYTPICERFVNREFESEGYEILKEHTSIALNELRELKIESRSFGGTPLADVFSKEVIMSLMISEQWDPLYFINDTTNGLKKILSEYGLNREEAFMWSVSSASAIGCLQFTNVRNNGTYALVVREYKEANLKINFKEGTRDMNNVIKAAICLLDYELSQSKKAKELFMKNKLIGSIYPVSAYNGGPIAADDMMLAIERLNGKAFDSIPSHLIKLPYAISLRRYKHGNAETPMYIKKYLYLMNQFNEIK